MRNVNENQCPNFVHLTKEKEFHYLLTNENPEICGILAKTVSKMSKEREISVKTETWQSRFS